MSSDSSGSGPESEDEIDVEWLVAGRQRRANAGNRMATLLATEEPVETQGDEEDDLKLLFQENAEEEDAEFGSNDEAVSDVEMGSSSDEEDGKEEDEDAGEREIERQAKEERKRKRNALITFGMSKRQKTTKSGTSNTVKTSDPTEAAPRPKKKSERVTWSHIDNDKTIRASSRKQTILNKQVVHQRMQENEKKRQQVLEAMEAAAKRREADKPKAMTQEDRLAEAAEVEAMNAKSLNRWEAAEQIRVTEQKAKLAALKNRTIQGPVMSVWSGPSKWADGNCIAIGKKAVRSGKHEQKMLEKRNGSSKTANKSKSGEAAGHGPSGTAIKSTVAPAITLSMPEVLQDLTGLWITKALGNAFLLHPGESQNIMSETSPTTLVTPATTQHVEIRSKTLILLDEESLEEPSIANSILVKPRKSLIRPHQKVPEKERCLITGMLARYRDPLTGVPYANMAAFKQLRANISTDSSYANGRWSTLLGTYVGSDAEAPFTVPVRLRRGVTT